jgi:hypothetical protein
VVKKRSFGQTGLFDDAVEAAALEAVAVEFLPPGATLSCRDDTDQLVSCQGKKKGTRTDLLSSVKKNCPRPLFSPPQQSQL